MTSLAQQLKRLAVPHTQTQLGQDTRRVSLLFDPKEAANLDRETFFALGTNGLEELENIDPSFAEFEATLFDESSLSFERSIQSREVNDKLNENIENFLIKLSPYFLLKPAHKAMEWLVHRFHIHQFNLDHLMQCIIPYHETKIFVRAVQMLKLDDPAHKWHWLHTIQKPGVPLARSTVVNHCYKDPGFMSFICNLVPKFMRCHAGLPNSASQCRVVMTFCISTILGAVNNCGNVTENMISQLLPFLVKGLKSKNVDYKAGSYMIVSQLVSKATMKEDFFDRLIPVLTKHISMSLVNEAVSCLVIIYQTQNLQKIGKKSFKHLCRVPGIIQCFQHLNSRFHITALLQPFLSRLVSAAIRDRGVAVTSSDGGEEMMQGPVQYASLLAAILSEVPLDQQLASFVISLLVEEYCSLRNERSNDEDIVNELHEHMKVFTAALERRYPVSMDEVIEKKLEENNDVHMKTILQGFVGLTVTGYKHQSLPESDTSLFLSLNHPKGQVRAMGVRHLFQSIDRAEKVDSFMKEALLARMDDDKAVVVQTVLEAKQVLLEVFENEELYTALKQILKNHPSAKKWTEVRRLALEVLVSASHQADDHSDLLTTVLPFVFLMSASDVSSANIVMTSNLAKQHPLLAKLGKVWMKERNLDGANVTKETIAQLNHTTITTIATTLEEMTPKKMTPLVTLLSAAVRDGDSGAALQWMVVSILTELVLLLKKADVKMDVMSESISCIKHVLSNAQSVDWKSEGQDNTSLEAVLMITAEGLRKSSRIPGQAVCQQINRVLSTLTTSAHLQKANWWTLENPGSTDGKYLECCVKLFDILTSTSADDQAEILPFRSLLTKLLKHFPTGLCLYKFLSLLWTYDAFGRFNEQPLAHPPPILQARALHITSHCLAVASSQQITELLSSSNTVVPSLVLALHSPHRSIREVTLTCLSALLKVSRESTDNMYTVLVKKLVASTEELTADKDHLPQALGVFFMRSFQTSQQATPKKNKKAEKKQLIMHCLDSWLALCVAKDTPLFVTNALLETLQYANHTNIFEKLLPLLDALLSKELLSKLQLSVIRLLIQHYTEEVAPLLLPSSGGFQLLHIALNKSFSLPDMEATQISILKQISKGFFSALPDESQQMLLKLLLDLMVDSTHPDLYNAVNSVCKRVTMKAEHILIELKHIKQNQDAKTVKQAKRVRRLSQPESVDASVIETRPWRRIVLILELLQNKKKIKDCQLMLPALFDIITTCLELSEQQTLDYLKQLVLSCIQNICQRLCPHGQPDKDVLSAEQFPVDSIVQCIRSSESAQTHHQALMLLTTAARLLPDHVLHNIMSIFTFMGANLMRQDDSYSFQVINKTIETVIPALIKAEEIDCDLSDKLEDMVSKVIRVFVDAQPHIPEHRRLPLFGTLVGTVGPMRFLWITMVMLAERHVTHMTGKSPDAQEDKSSSGLHPEVEFCLSICHHFPVVVQLSTCRKMIKYLTNLPPDKEDKPKPTRLSSRTPRKTKPEEQKVELFDVDGHTAKQLKHFRFNITNLIISVLSSDAFIAQVVELSAEESDKLPGQYQALLEMSLRYITVVAKVANQHATDASARFWRALLHKVYDILDKINALLPGSLFIQVVSGLMYHDLPMVRRKSMDLLNNKLQAQQFDSHDVEALLHMVPQLTIMVKASQLNTGDSDVATNRQTALLSLKILCKMFGQQHPQIFKPVLTETVSLLSSVGLQSAVKASGLLCLAELCSSLHAHAIPHLREFMPILISLLTDNPKQFQGSDLLVVSAVTAVQRVVSTLPHFLSPYLQDILLMVTKLSCSEDSKDKNQKSQLHIRLKSVRNTLASVLPPRVLLPALSESYSRLADDDRVALCGLFVIMKEHISNISKEDLVSHNATLINFFLQALDYRQNHEQIPLDDVMETEGHVVSAVIAMVMRLSEATFRPTFFKLYDWASHNEMQTDRLLVFYRLSDSIADSLKSLFCLFAGHIVKNAADLLNQTNVAKTESTIYGASERGHKKCSLLLQFTLDCLTKIFMYDNEGFLTTERFDTLMQPLVDQIENMHGGEEEYMARVQKHLLPCIAHFAAAAADDANWKSLNYQILLKTRHDSAKVRFSSLQVIEEVSRKLGDDYMPLLPETIPFLAELMEDESEEVEKLCQEVVTEMEKILGEPIQKYF